MSPTRSTRPIALLAALLSLATARHSPPRAKISDTSPPSSRSSTRCAWQSLVTAPPRSPPRTSAARRASSRARWQRSRRMRRSFRQRRRSVHQSPRSFHRRRQSVHQHPPSFHRRVACRRWCRRAQSSPSCHARCRLRAIRDRRPGRHPHRRRSAGRAQQRHVRRRAVAAARLRRGSARSRSA
jgi:hypothetical protein